MPEKVLLIKAFFKLVQDSDLKVSGERKVLIPLEDGSTVEVVVKVDAIEGFLKLVSSDD